MRPEEARKLVGGYATGTLTPEERRALFEAALGDQELYNELARDQSFKELLDDPRARLQLMHALAEKRPLLGRPASWALAGGLAVVALLVVVFVRTGQPPPQPQPVLTAKREAQAPPPPTEKPQLEEKAEEAPAVPAEVKSKAAPAMSAFRARVADQLAAVPYRILRADAEGQYTEVEPQTAFRAEDRLRVAFDPPEDGRLRVTTTDTGGASRVLLDADVHRAVTTNLDVPPGEQKLVLSFTPSSTSQPAVFEIQIRR